ncbi:MAG: glycosyltransferase family 2 protein [Chloroflexi bacterium]|nr:glycosyltransferase family 2 protein [Chloroflexota bacterium]
MKLSIVIVSWNTSAVLEACLDAVYTFPLQDPFEIWLVDNHSSDDSVPMVQNKFPQVNLIVSDENLGFSGGNNLAIPYCTGELILLLNSDTEVKAQALQALIDFMDGHDEAGVAGSFLLNSDGSLQESCHPFPTLGRELWRMFHLDRIRSYSNYDMASWNQNQPYEVDALMGASLLIRKHILDTIGLLDERYFMYSEEVDLCLRVQRAGWKLFWVPQSQVLHLGGQSSKRVHTKMFLQLYRGKVLFFRKHDGRIVSIIYKFILVSASIVRLLLIPFVWLLWPLSRKKNALLAQNYARLLIALFDM